MNECFVWRRERYRRDLEHYEQKLRGYWDRFIDTLTCTGEDLKHRTRTLDADFCKPSRADFCKPSHLDLQLQILFLNCQLIELRSPFLSEFSKKSCLLGVNHYLLLF